MDPRIFPVNKLSKQPNSTRIQLRGKKLTHCARCWTRATTILAADAGVLGKGAQT
jgi:hypothetical protein